LIQLKEEDKKILRETVEKANEKEKELVEICK